MDNVPILEDIKASYDSLTDKEKIERLEKAIHILTTEMDKFLKELNNE